MARMLAVVLAASALLQAAALDRPKGARRRAMERAARMRAAGGDVAAAPKPPAVYCPETDVLLEGSDEPVCQPETRAETLASLKREYTASFSQAVADAVSSAPQEGTYMTISSWRGGSLLGNWLAHTRLMSEDEPQRKIKVVNVALDVGAVNGCENFRLSLPADGRLSLTCVSLVGWLPKSIFDAETATGGRAKHCENNLQLWARPLILLNAVVASEQPIMLVNTDVIVHKDMLGLGAELLESGKRKMVAAAEGNGKLNTDTIFASKASLPFLAKWVEQSGKCMNSEQPDKGALQHVMHYEDGGAWGQKLGTFYTTEIGQCMKRGEYATHFNCAGKYAATVMKGMRNWADGISQDPKEVVKPSQLFNMTAKKNPTKKKA